jgi:alpha-beta hydrolase superfamily lysophospholipase
MIETESDPTIVPETTEQKLKAFAFRLKQRLAQVDRVAWYLLGGILILVSLLLFFWFARSRNTSGGITPSLLSEEFVRPLSESPTPTPTPTPFLFEELTIPYLSRREYHSRLGELNLVGSNTAYTSYLTDYDSDGLRINALLTIPTAEAPPQGFPAVVFVHGYIPPSRYQTQQNYQAYVDSLARNGLVVFKIDLRGHGSSQGDASGAYYSGDYVIDTLNALAALQTLDRVDPQRIGLWGHSMAGNVVFRALAAQPSIKRVVIWAGAVYSYEDFAEFRIMDGSYQPPPEESERRRKRELLFSTYGQFDPNSWFWQQVPATKYLTQITGSVQLHHAANDDVVSIEYSRNLSRILDQASIDHELFEYSGGGHNLTGESFNQAMSRTAEFLREEH